MDDADTLDIEVFGATLTVTKGLVKVKYGGTKKLYTRLLLPALETAIEMQKRIEKDIVELQRIKVRRIFCACTRSSSTELSRVVPRRADQFSSSSRRRGAKAALAPWGHAYSFSCLAAASAILGCKGQAFTRLSRGDAVAAALEAAGLRRSCCCIGSSASDAW
jgi:hypothetical protein